MLDRSRTLPTATIPCYRPKIALKLADYVVTESGFGADLGAEKFMDITCRYGGFAASCVNITATIRALKMHGFGRMQDRSELELENLEMLDKGCANLAKQIENMKLFGIPVVVTVNRFVADTDAEVELGQEARPGVRRRGLQPDHRSRRWR